MKRVSTTSIALPPTDMGAVGKAWDEVSASFDRFCLAAGVDALGAMMEKDAEEACGARHARSEGRRGHRWGRTQGKIGFHAGKVAIERPRVRDLAGQELALPSWDRAVAEDWLGKWAMNLMLINVSTRKFRRAVRLPEGDVPAPTGAGVSKSAASRHFVALSAARMKEWMGADLSGLDIMVVQIDGIHIGEHLVLVAALGIDSEGFKHPLGLMEGATEHSAVVQALIDDLIERGLDPAVPRLFNHRRLEGALQGDPAQLRVPHADPALPDSQGPEYHGASIAGSACLGPACVAPGLGTRRRGEGGEADPQPRPTPGARRPRRLEEHPGGIGRDPHGEQARFAG